MPDDGLRASQVRHSQLSSMHASDRSPLPDRRLRERVLCEPALSTRPVVFVVDVGASVSVRDEAPASTVPCLRGDAVVLIEALSLRAPLPLSAPIEWSQLLDGLATAFDAV